MVKGVNKTVIEVNNTGNRFFSRAILFVEPDFAKYSEKRLKREAEKLVGDFGTESAGDTLRAAVKKKNRKMLLYIAAAVVFTAAVTLAVILL